MTPIPDETSLDVFDPNVNYYRLSLQMLAELKVLEAMRIAPPNMFSQQVLSLRPSIAPSVSGSVLCDDNGSVSEQGDTPPDIICRLGDLSYQSHSVPKIAFTNDLQVDCESATSNLEFSASNSSCSEGHSVLSSVAKTSQDESSSRNTFKKRITQKFEHQHQHQCPHDGCGKVFRAAGILKVHVATHTKERNFKCTLCSASYTTNNRLTVHMRGHTGEKPYCCSFPGCQYRAKQKCSLKVHGLTHMSAQERLVLEEQNKRTILCHECGKYYKTMESLDQHSWKDHGKGAVLNTKAEM